MNPTARQFLWGASTAPHQIEGNNLNSDFWASERLIPGMQTSGDAVDSYHRYPEDMRLLADAGLNTYRFGIEWARIEPEPGEYSRAELAHYRRMIDTARGFGLTPVITLHHFTSPRWFGAEGGWSNGNAVTRFSAFARATLPILDDIEWICTINEPNMLALMAGLSQALSGRADESDDRWSSPTLSEESAPVLPAPDLAVAAVLADAHHAVREILHSGTDAAVGWTVANQAYTAAPGGEERLVIERDSREDVFLRAARGDDFIGVQAYSSQLVDANGVVAHPAHPDNTLTGAAYRPDALGMAVRHTWEVTGGVPILVTENGIATTDDRRRIEYIGAALAHLADAAHDGVDVRGYLHWSLLDNYEWGHWEPTFGLIAVNRETFGRFPKPSLGWLGDYATGHPDGPTTGASR